MSSDPEDDYNNNDQSADVDIDVDMADSAFRAPPMAGRSARAKRPSMKAAASFSVLVPAPPAKLTPRSASPPNFFSDEDDAARSKPLPVSPKPANKRAAAPPKARKPPAKRAKRRASDSESDFDDPDVVVDDDLSGLDNDDDDNRSARGANTSAPSKLKGRGIIMTNAKGKATAQKKKAAKESEAIAISARNEGASSSKKPPAKRSSSEDKDSNAAASEQSQPPPAKKAKLPAVPRKSGAPSGLRTSGLPATPATRPSLAKQPSVAKKGGDIDLNNADEYNKLFGISGTSGSSVRNSR